MATQDFLTSRELRLFFNQQLEQWQERTDGTLKELAEKCGVSPSYLSQVGRYGRIPGKPVVILLAFNFGLRDPSQFYKLCGFADEWPYDTRMALSRDKGDEQSFLSVKVDMPGLTDAIRAIMKDEMRSSNSRSIGSRPLRIGLNPMQPWMHEPGGVTAKDGFFREFCRFLGIALHRPIELKVVPFSRYAEMLRDGDLDMYGPVMAAPAAHHGIGYSTSLLRVGVSVLYRVRASQELADLPTPKKFEDLSNPQYQIAALRSALPHFVINTRLNREDESLVLCDSDEEAADRVLLRGIKNSAHAFVCNSLMAQRIAKEHPKDVQLLFNDKKSFVDYEDITIAVGAEWRSALDDLNNAIRFLLDRGAFGARLMGLFDTKARTLVDSAEPGDGLERLAV